MSIYRQVLGEQFKLLHPKLQQRYDFPQGSFRAKGVMKEIRGGVRWLAPLYWMGVSCKLLFPERGEEIPFTIVNTCSVGEKGEPQIHWERTFYFHNRRRYFNALMSLDRERNMIKDYLGEPRILYSDLRFQIGAEGDIQIESDRQRLVIGKWEIPLPKLLHGIARVRECYIEERDVFSIDVEVRNPLLGLIFAYQGEFQNDED